MSSQPPPTTSLLGERADDKEILVEFLLTGATEESWNVVPIVGAARVGKTNLLQHIYNDPAVLKHFGDLRTWVSAGKGLQMVELMKKIGECLTERSCSDHQLGVVQDVLKKAVNGQRFLLVLDDLCFETVDGDQWKNLHAAFDGCGSGSAIMLTTRDERVADKTGTVPLYILDSHGGGEGGDKSHLEDIPEE